MFKRTLLVLIATSLFTKMNYAQEPERFQKIKSNNSVAITIDKIQVKVSKLGLTVFSRVKHSASAAKLNININSSELIIFGNPAIGSKLMKCNPEIGVELPIKAHAWEDAKGNVFLSYTNFRFIQDKYSLKDCALNAIKKSILKLDRLMKSSAL